MFVVAINGIGTLGVQESGVAGVVSVRNILSVECTADNIVQLAVGVTVQTTFFGGTVSVLVGQVVIHSLW